MDRQMKIYLQKDNKYIYGQIDEIYLQKVDRYLDGQIDENIFIER